MHNITTRARRGMSLIEGMISMAILVVGILGALQGILYASQQNGVAARLARATSMAAQIRFGIEAQGRTKLLAASGPIGSSTTCIAAGAGTTQAFKDLTDGLWNTTLAGACIVDVDLWDSTTAATANDRLVPNYNFTTLAGDYNPGASTTGGPFRRMLVYLPNPSADVIVVVVSTPEVGRRVFVRQTVGLYDSSTAGNSAGVNL
jgi:Tfp pilus assembly protein PilV